MGLRRSRLYSVHSRLYVLITPLYVPNELAEKLIAAHETAHGEQLVEEEA
jgi:hypothetical protein